MAEVVLATASERQTWHNKFFKEYVRQSGYAPYMGTSERNIFRVLTGEGSTASIINFPYLGTLKGRGVMDAEVLEGNEEDLENANDQVRTRWRRNGVTVPKSTSYKTELNILDAAKGALRDWSARNLRNDLSNVLKSIIVPGIADESGMPGTDTAISYEASSAAQRNAYLAANQDRILFGASRANGVSGNWATALGTVDATNDKLTPANISAAKRLVRGEGEYDDGMMPYTTEDGREYFVLFANPRSFRDLKTDPVMTQANREVRERGLDNPIFQDGDLVWDGVVIREIPSIGLIPGAGAGGIDVARNFLCGRSAIGIGIGQRPELRLDNKRDYEFRPSVGIEELRGQKKLSRGGRLYAVAELITAATPDA